MVTRTQKATALVGFKLGPWHKTDGDAGNGDPGTIVDGATSAIVTVVGPDCVWICCPFSVGGGCPAPGSDQCL